MKIHHLEMTSPGELRPSSSPEQPELSEVTPPDGRRNQWFYRTVGAEWQWRDRAEWSVEAWNAYLRDEPITTLVIALGGEPIGYAELRDVGGDIEIVYFGLLGAFVGRGLGGASLTEVARFAWRRPGTRRVWLHTCELDHPAALANYQRRGFRLFHVEEV